MAETFNITKRRHPDYDANSSLWAFYMQSYKGGAAYSQGNLFTHRLENPQDFANRQKRAYFLNYCRPLPNIYTDYLYRESAKRPPGLFPDVIMNIDGRGRTIEEFSRMVSVLASIYGQVHVLVDKPADDAGVSAAEAKAPYAIIYKPEYVLDWSHDDNGNLLWVLLHEPLFDDVDPNQPRKKLNRYRLLTLEGWEVINVDEKGEVSSRDQGNWALERIPFVTCIHNDIDHDLIGESMLVDIAPINRTIFNWSSCIDEQIERQTFSQLIMPDDGEGGQDSVKAISTSAIFTFPNTAKFAPQYISPDTAQVKTIWEMVERHIAEIYRLALLEKSGDLAMGNQSGIAKAYDFIDTNQAIASKAQSMERFENDLLAAIGLWYGKDTSTERISYPKEFDVIALEKEIKNSFDLISEGISETFNKLLMKRMVRKALKSASSDEFKTIDAEIEAKQTIATTDINLATTHAEQIHGPEATISGQDNTVTQ